MKQAGDRLRVSLFGIELKNPVIGASGVFSYGLDIEDDVPIKRFGGFVTKGISPEPIDGNPQPRTCETPCAILNSIALQNIGVEKFITEYLPRYDLTKQTVFVNIFGHSISDYLTVAEKLHGERNFSGFEVNISCPNVDKGGAQFGSDPKIVEDLISQLRKTVGNRFLMVKLSPNFGNIVALAQASEAAGADAVSLVNTFLGMRIDIRTRRPLIRRNVGGLSGPAIMPMALRMVWEVSRAVKIPVVGMGGISCAEDVIEFMLAGATCVQIGTAILRKPDIINAILPELTRLMKEMGIARISDIVGQNIPY